MSKLNIEDYYNVLNNKLVTKTVFSFDFDNTISRDVDGFIFLMEYLQKRGHDVYVVTARRPDIHPEDFAPVEEKGFKVIKTRHIAKKHYMREIEGIEVDVWIDDCPEAILGNWDGQPRTFRDADCGK